MIKRSGNELSPCGELLRGLAPFVPEDPLILILGSMPSAASIKAGFYYAHPQNRFFKVIAALFGEALPDLVSRKRALSSMRIALFDVIRECRRKGSLDQAITDAKPNDIPEFLTAHSSIKVVVTNGGLSARLLSKQKLPEGIRVFNLPSTSPANAVWRIDKLTEVYKEALNAAGIKTVI